MRNIIWERAVIVIGLLSFWPWIAGFRGIWYQVFLVLVCIELGRVAVVRLRRVKGALERKNGFGE